MRDAAKNTRATVKDIHLVHVYTKRKKCNAMQKHVIDRKSQIRGLLFVCFLHALFQSSQTQYTVIDPQMLSKTNSAEYLPLGYKF